MQQKEWTVLVSQAQKVRKELLDLPEEVRYNSSEYLSLSRIKKWCKAQLHLLETIGDEDAGPSIWVRDDTCAHLHAMLATAYEKEKQSRTAEDHDAIALRIRAAWREDPRLTGRPQELNQQNIIRLEVKKAPALFDKGQYAQAASCYKQAIRAMEGLNPDLDGRKLIFSWKKMVEFIETMKFAPTGTPLIDKRLPTWEARKIPLVPLPAEAPVIPYANEDALFAAVARYQAFTPDVAQLNSDSIKIIREFCVNTIKKLEASLATIPLIPNDVNVWRVDAQLADMHLTLAKIYERENHQQSASKIHYRYALEHRGGHWLEALPIAENIANLKSIAAIHADLGALLGGHRYLYTAEEGNQKKLEKTLAHYRQAIAIMEEIQTGSPASFTPADAEQLERWRMERDKCIPQFTETGTPVIASPWRPQTVVIPKAEPRLVSEALRKSTVSLFDRLEQAANQPATPPPAAADRKRRQGELGTPPDGATAPVGSPPTPVAKYQARHDAEKAARLRNRGPLFD